MKQLEKLTQRFAWRLLPAILLAIVCLTGCQKEPVFPDPGIDMSQSQDIVISCDTATIYNMNLKITTPAGLQVLELINANSNTVIEDFSDKYRNKTDFVFEYEVVLPEVDTILSYNIRIVDAQSKVINQPFNITVRAGKIPIINVFGGNVKSVISPSFVLKAKMFAGKKPISKYELTYEGVTVLDTKVFETPVDSHDYEFFCDLPLKIGTPGKLTLSTFEADGKKASVDIMIHLTAGNYPIRVVYEGFFNGQETAHLFYHMYFAYNENNMVSSVKEDMLLGEKEGLKRMLYFTYNDKKMVTDLKIEYGDGFVVNKFQYDNEGRFIASSRCDEQDISDPNTDVTVLGRDAKGYVTAILRGTTAKVEEIQYETVGDETLLIDFIDIATAVTPQTRSHLVGNTSATWPTYNPGLPPFFAEIVDKHILNLFCYKYIYADRVTTHGMPGSRFEEAGDSIAKYTYELDAKGRVSRIQIERPMMFREGFWDYDIYTFEYAD